MVSLAAVNFEWAVGRCILFFGKPRNIELRERLCRCAGLKKYKELWKEELIKHDSSISPLAELVKNWQKFDEAFTLRHRLIHGRVTCTRNMATEPVKEMLVIIQERWHNYD